MVFCYFYVSLFIAKLCSSCTRILLFPRLFFLCYFHQIIKRQNLLQLDEVNLFLSDEAIGAKRNLNWGFGKTVLIVTRFYAINKIGILPIFFRKNKSKKRQKTQRKKFAYLTLKVFKLFNCKVCEMFVYKHTETREYVKK